MLTVGWGTFADVDGDVEDGALDAADEFGLGEWWGLEVEAAHHAVGGHALVVLYELDAMTKDWGDCFVEVTFGEALEEVAAGVAEYFWFNNYYAVNGGFDYVDH